MLDAGLDDREQCPEGGTFLAGTGLGPFHLDQLIVELLQLFPGPAIV